MIRQTSIDVFRRIEAEGLLSAQRLKVYKILFVEGPLTGSEINELLGGKSYHKRLSELLDLGVVVALGRRTCRVTGESVLEWDVNSLLPRTPVKF